MTKQKLIDLFINSQENLNPRTYKRHGIKFELDQNGEFLLEIKSQSASYTYGFYSVEDEIFGIDHGSFFKEDSLNADKLNFLVETSKQKIEYHQTIKNGFKEIITFNLWATPKKNDKIVIVSFKDESKYYIIPYANVIAFDNLIKNYIHFNNLEDNKIIHYSISVKRRTNLP